jgi:hypothetical protein
MFEKAIAYTPFLLSKHITVNVVQKAFSDVTDAKIHPTHAIDCGLSVWLVTCQLLGTPLHPDSQYGFAVLVSVIPVYFQ